MTTDNRLHYAFPRLPDSKLLPLLREKYGTELELFYDGHVVWIKFENFVVGRGPYLTRNFDDDWNWEKDSSLKLTIGTSLCAN